MEKEYQKLLENMQEKDDIEIIKEMACFNAKVNFKIHEVVYSESLSSSKTWIVREPKKEENLMQMREMFSICVAKDRAEINEIIEEIKKRIQKKEAAQVEIKNKQAQIEVQKKEVPVNNNVSNDYTPLVFISFLGLLIFFLIKMKTK